MVQSRLANAPGFQVLHVIQSQLQAMHDAIRRGHTPTTEDKKHITEGILAVWELKANVSLQETLISCSGETCSLQLFDLRY